jgi:membrane protein DedA with SNARE-associated domain
MEEPGWIQTLLDVVARHHGDWGVIVLFLSSLIEYVFPPFPGDVVTLFGTYLVIQGLWSFPFALFLATAGSLVGAAIDYGIGTWVGRHLDRIPSKKTASHWSLLTQEKYHLLLERFRKYGIAIIAINRFLPGIRAFFFVAAGAAAMPLWIVLVFAAISAILWNTLLLGTGLAVGANWPRLQQLFQSYSMAVWILLAAFLLAGLTAWWIRRRCRTPR